MKPIAIDLFCGAGGMSEGIIQAGFHIAFSSDINDDVMKTYVNRHKQLGLIQGINTHFEKSDIKKLTGKFILDKISNLKEFECKNVEIDAIFGGPPCQGFSMAGKRLHYKDKKNFLFREYIRLIQEIKPKYIVIENVVGLLTTIFKNYRGINGKKYKGEVLAPQIICSELKLIGYETSGFKEINAADFEVPQTRRRVFLIAHLPGLPRPIFPPVASTNSKMYKPDTLDAIGDLIQDEEIKRNFNKKLSRYQIESQKGRTPNLHGVTIPLKDKLANMELSTHNLYTKQRFSLFEQGEETQDLKNRINHLGVDLLNKRELCKHTASLLIKEELKQISKSEFQKELSDLEPKQVCIAFEKMKCNLNDKYSINITSTESEDLAINEVITALETIYRNGNVNSHLLELLLSKKNKREKLDANMPSPTVVTLPDDFIHPYENRILSVRELARLQSFDDSFEFLGTRTTGSDRRKLDVPQYTQVGNAVPPLVAKAVACEIIKSLNEINKKSVGVILEDGLLKMDA